MATKKLKPRRFNEGDLVEAADKAAGLEASKDEKVGFFERLRMGNIDQEGSEAYNRFGAGRAKADRARAESKPSTNVYRVDSGPGAMGMSDEDKPSTDVYRVDSGPGKMSTGATKVTPTKRPIAPTPARAASSSPYRVDSGPGSLGMSYSNEGRSSKTYKADTSNYSNEGRGREMTAKQKAEYAIDSARPTEEQTQKGLETASSIMGGASLKTLHGLAKKLAKPKMAQYTQQALPSPTKGLPYDKAGAVAKRRAERAASRNEEMLQENAKRYGLDPNSPGYDAAAKAVRKEMGGRDFSFKKGGKVKKMASGGSTSGASKRADGIAQRGKTRGRIY